MELFAGFSFLTPWALAALAGLPILWWLLRVTPPAPKRVAFPAIRLLFGLKPHEETPFRTPWWLILLRLILATLLILALAHPVFDRQPVAATTQPLLLVIDDGWSAAPNWSQQRDAALASIDRAERSGREIWYLTTAPRADESGVVRNQLAGPLTAEAARATLSVLDPQPWPTDRNAALRQLQAADHLPPAFETLWLSDGVADDTGENDAELSEFLLARGPVSLARPATTTAPMLLLPPRIESQSMILSIMRNDGGAARRIVINGQAKDGQVILREAVDLPAGTNPAEITFNLPPELRNRLTRLAIEGQESAGAVILLDERNRRRPVGLVTQNPSQDSQPFLGEIFYLERALQPFSDLHRGTVADLLKRPLSMITLPDGAGLAASDRESLNRWIEQGGTLVRFAGPVLAQSPDDLVPVGLRSGDRQLGGVLTWGQPAQLSDFPAGTPFSGLNVPADVTVTRQVLAEPAIDLGDHTWARLSDGTPLVTARQQGDGWLILVHTTANTDWSNLALSGLFVDMLRRLLENSLGAASGDGTADMLPPLRLLNGYGQLSAPHAGAQPLPLGQLNDLKIGPHHVPGLYGKEEAQRALNLSDRIKKISPLTVPGAVEEISLSTDDATDLKPFLLLAAIILFLADFIIAFALRGLARPVKRAAQAMVILAILAVGALPWQSPAHADPIEDLARETLRELRLGYVLTGVPRVDAVSQAGMRGLSAFVAQKTAAEPAEPFAVNLEQDDLAFFPLLYWPITEGQTPLSETALRRVNDYLKRGGIILFDTQSPTGSGGTDWLQRAGAGIDIPALMPIPADHVLGKAFYLLPAFPGRWDGGTLWVENTPSTVNDGVSSVVIGSNDWAAAWAVDPYGQPMFPITPGGEAQREKAYRFGVNLVMYALTGNYKADQVHVPAILERLGQ